MYGICIGHVMLHTCMNCVLVLGHVGGTQEGRRGREGAEADGGRGQ